MITLREITPDNWREIIALKVREDQRHFVESNVGSLAEAKVFPEHVPLAVYADEKPVGFVMYTYVDERKEHWIFRLMLADGEQNKGYGREAMRLTVQQMRERYGCQKIFISFEPENAVAEHLYASLGFRPTGEVLGGEVVYRLDLGGDLAEEA